MLKKKKEERGREGEKSDEEGKRREEYICARLFRCDVRVNAGGQQSGRLGKTAHTKPLPPLAAGPSPT